MLDALRGLAGAGTAQQQVDDLKDLLTSARQERTALSAILTQVTMRGAKLAHVSRALEDFEANSAVTIGTLDEIARRVAGLEDRSTEFADLDTRVRTLLDAATNARLTAEQLIAPGSDLQQHRQQVQQLFSQVRDTQTDVQTLKLERASLDDLRAQLQQSQREMKQSIEQASMLRGELDQLKGSAGQLAQDYGRLRDTSREASSAAVEAVKATEEKLSSLNALAEHLAEHVQALGDQKDVVERALLETTRLNEMVSSMKAHISTLNENLTHPDQGEEAAADVGRRPPPSALPGHVLSIANRLAQFQDKLAEARARFKEVGHSDGTARGATGGSV